MRLQSKTAFITGGTSGIGFATAQAFIQQGAFVGITGRSRERVDTAVSSLGNMCAGFVADAADDEHMAAAFLGTAQHSGRIDIVFANAGHYVHIPLGQASRAALEAQFRDAANVFMTVHLALPHLSEGASIILMGSTYATMGPPGAGVYAASKAAVSALGRSMASELSPRGIRVNVVVPGAVYTPSWGMESLQPDLKDRHRKLIGERAPLNRMITAEEVANTVVFLASDESSGLQATEIVVDGGTTGASAGSPRFIQIGTAWFCMAVAIALPFIGRLAPDIRLDPVESADAVEGLFRNGRTVCGMDIEKLTPDMGPAGGLRSASGQEQKSDVTSSASDPMLFARHVEEPSKASKADITTKSARQIITAPAFTNCTACNHRADLAFAIAKYTQNRAGRGTILLR